MFEVEVDIEKWTLNDDRRKTSVVLQGLFILVRDVLTDCIVATVSQLPSGSKLALVVLCDRNNPSRQVGQDSHISWSIPHGAKVWRRA